MASLVSMQRGTGMAVVSHYNVAPVIDIFGALAGRDLGGVARDIDKIIEDSRGSNYPAVLTSLFVGRFRPCEPPTSAF